ncbi:LysR substrate-binding domain-containing protein [Mesorhizobium australafricanum]|uniref:LysR substrate-binding domain-containing protein n=1 Tax=Mesorhizobium australafricanum TaxID=3072311 RepID=A0ABU4X8X0_9HYPH|nr:LysR substrate-binding domain-containing protein [Mesorhizobium sp. VK3E]MDX8443587.1 LysR substrate-binding domain-containing protein [Mesorhizobium sp. VK3E]
MGRKIPPFAAIRAFEALARHGNLQAAGDELGISASAISHQVKSLESHVGTKLLIKSDNRLRVTKAGSNLASELREILDLLEASMLKVSLARKTGRVSINLFPSLAELWMVPLLARFAEQHPEISVTLVTNPEKVDLSGSDIDLAIQYGVEPSSAEKSFSLIQETITPVCSSAFLARRGPITQASDLLSCPLIYCASAPDEWRIWTEENDVALGDVRHWLEVDTRSAALRAAEQNMGIAIGRRPFVDLALARGSLVQIFESPMFTGMTYFLVTPTRSWSVRNVRTFSTWLIAASKAENPFLQLEPAD